MNIRSLTIGASLPEDGEARATLIGWLGSFAQAGRAVLQGVGFTVQTTRLSTQPLELWVGEPGRAAERMAEVGRQCADAGIDYCSLGTLQATSGENDGRIEALLEEIPSLLIASENLFASVQVGARSSVGAAVNLHAVRASARIIRALSEGTAGGFGNLRFAAAANCPPHIPFFPASYYVEDHRNRGNPQFGIALEAADLPVAAFREARSHDEARGNLLALLVEQGSKVAEACGALSSEHGYTFTGLDISMAPYPEEERSIGRALEMVSGSPLGTPGTLTAAAFVTDVLKEARKHLPTVGYSGLMLPALEDQTLADRAAEGTVDLDTLLLLSAVCGLGLDTVPLPGDVSTEQIGRIILDMASLAVKLDKPLTARLLPVPGREAGEAAEWPDFPYFARGKVMAVRTQPAGESLFNDKWLRFV